MEKVRFSFIAAGRMANVMAKELKKLPEVEMVAVYDPLQDRCREFAEKYGFEKACSSLEEVLADKSAQGIVICNYCYQHCETILKVLDAGFKRIFCEKPVMRQVEDAQKVLEAVKAAGATVMIGHHRKHILACQKMKEVIDSGILGKIRFARVNFCNSWFARDWSDYFSSYELSGGTTLDMTTHYVDLLNWYFGEAESATGRAIMLERNLPKDVLPFDFMNANLTYKNGVLCSITSSYQRYGVSTDTMEVYGDEYTAITDYKTVKLYRKKETIEYDTKMGEPNAERLVQAKELVAMVKDGKPRQTTLEEGIQAAKVVLGIMASCEKNGEIFRF